MPVDKQAIRERIWNAIDGTEGVARFPGARGRIPNFVGAERAAERLAELPEWQRARRFKVNPDSPQLPVRARALAEGKILYLPVPRLAAEQPFLRLQGSKLRVPARKAASIRGASKHGTPVDPDSLEHIDLIVCGTVAVDERGARVGKGGGYSDLEYAIGRELGIVDDDTVIVTTVHELQVVPDRLPETSHDFGVDIIVTPERVLRPHRRKRPKGIIWSHLDGDKLAAIPVLGRWRGSGLVGVRSR